MNPKSFDDITAKFAEMVKNSPFADVEKNAKAMMSGALAKLDVVPREEFDIQTQVLARTRAQLEALEARVTALEKSQQSAA